MAVGALAAVASTVQLLDSYVKVAVVCRGKVNSRRLIQGYSISKVYGLKEIVMFFAQHKENDTSLTVQWHVRY